MYQSHCGCRSLHGNSCCQHCCQVMTMEFPLTLTLCHCAHTCCLDLLCHSCCHPTCCFGAAVVVTIIRNGAAWESLSPSPSLSPLADCCLVLVVYCCCLVIINLVAAALTLNLGLAVALLLRLLLLFSKTRHCDCDGLAVSVTFVAYFCVFLSLLVRRFHNGAYYDTFQYHHVRRLSSVKNYGFKKKIFMIRFHIGWYYGLQPIVWNRTGRPIKCGMISYIFLCCSVL